MLNLCHIFSLKGKKICAFVLIVCLIWGLTPTAESISVKLRGKVALGGILSGLAYVTYALVTRDRRAAERLKVHLGPPDRVIQFERGFDRWRINYYGEQCYLFRNNRLIGEKPLKASFSIDAAPAKLGWKTGRLQEGMEGWKDGRKKRPSTLPIFYSLVLPPFLIDTPVSRNPKWLWLYLSRPQRVPQLVSSCLYQLEGERLLGPQPWLSR